MAQTVVVNGRTHKVVVSGWPLSRHVACSCGEIAFENQTFPDCAVAHVERHIESVKSGAARLPGKVTMTVTPDP